MGCIDRVLVGDEARRPRCPSSHVGHGEIAVNETPGKSDATADDALSRLKQVEVQLSRMTKVFMDGADPIVIRDLDGNVLDFNLETERVFGWKRDEVRGTRAKIQLAPEYRELADEILHRVQRGETVRNVEVLVLTKAGGRIPVLVTVFPLTDEQGRQVGYAEIVKDITPLKRAHARLLKKNQELSQFANVLTHDLRAPLHTIRGFADLIQGDCRDARGQQCQEYLREIMEGVDRMDRLISDVLEYARVENQTIQFESVDCRTVLDEALANLHGAIVESGAQISSDDLPTIQANRSQMVQLFQNLIGNALKFRGEAPLEIRVACSEQAREWDFSIRDNGIGIDAEHQDKIFDAFQRIHADGVFPGTGIGLSTCRSIVQRHGGRIWVESQRGGGSTFYFSIPKPTAALSATESPSINSVPLAAE